MSISDDFKKMKILYEAIVDIDHAIKRNSDDVLEEILNAVKDIDKKEYPDEVINTIIDAIRCSLISLYKDQQTELNSIIGLGPVSTLDGFNIKKEIKDQRS